MNKNVIHKNQKERDLYESKCIKPVQFLFDIISGKISYLKTTEVMVPNCIHENLCEQMDGSQNFETEQGIEAWQTWIMLLRKSVPNLRVVNTRFYVDKQVVRSYGQWQADAWHKDIKGNPKYSNVFNFNYIINDEFKIVKTETIRQNYMFLFGTNFDKDVLRKQYKQIVGMESF